MPNKTIFRIFLLGELNNIANIEPANDAALAITQINAKQRVRIVIARR